MELKLSGKLEHRVKYIFYLRIVLTVTLDHCANPCDPRNTIAAQINRVSMPKFANKTADVLAASKFHTVLKNLKAQYLGPVQPQHFASSLGSLSYQQSRGLQYQRSGVLYLPLRPADPHSSDLARVVLLVSVVRELVSLPRKLVVRLRFWDW